MTDSTPKGFGERGSYTRRDFLDGVAIGTAGLAAAAAAPYLTGAEAALVERGSKPLPEGYYPPSETGIVGQGNKAIRKTMRVDGPPRPDRVHTTEGGPGIDKPVSDTGEAYDCVIVGAGISGLASAKWYQDRFGPDSKILLLDPLRDFGGHAHRNEFHVPNGAANNADTTLLRWGGSINLDSIGTWNQPAGSPAVGYDIPGSYGQPALDMLGFLGVDIDTFPELETAGFPDEFGLRSMLLFPAADFGSDTLVEAKGEEESWEDFVLRTPYSAQAKADLVRWMTDTTTDYITQHDGPKTDAQKKATLARITYLEYLTRYVGIGTEAASYLQRSSHGLYGAGIQAVQAGDLYLLGEPGFDGLALEYSDFPGVGRTAQFAASPLAEPTLVWPDGNSSLARLLVSRLIPQSFPDVGGARPNQETIFNATCLYPELDRKGHNVRIRLNSYVFDVKPAKESGGAAKIDYIVGGKGRRVRATHVVMACWNRITAHLVDGLPRNQIRDLCYARKVPLVYARAALNNWQAFADARISSISPRGNSLFWDSTTLNGGVSFGSTYGPTPNSSPAEPALLQFNTVPTDPSRLTQLSAYEAGRQVLLEMSFDELEGALIDVLDRSLNTSGGNFEPERDINAIIINRWNYGYAYELTSTFDPTLFGPNDGQPHVRGRRPFRNVAIANSDSGALAYAHSAINEGYRAVNDLPAAPAARLRRRRRARNA